MGKKVLITGGGGYIGSISVYEFLKKGFEVVVVDNFSTGFKQPLVLLKEKFGENRLGLYELDLHDDLTSVFVENPDILAVVHFAGSIVVNESMKDPNKYFYNNVCGSTNLISQMIKYNVKNLIFSSTCAVLGDAEYLPLDENHPSKPNNPYGQSKKMVEKIISWNAKLLGLKYVIFRYFNVCGALEDGSVGYSNKPPTHLVNNAVRGALGIAPFYLTCSEVDTKDKTPIRDYANVIDLADAHLEGVEYLLNGGRSEVINLGTGTGNSVLEIVQKVEELTGSKLNVQKSEPREGEAPELVASIKKAKEVLGWEPKRSLEDSIKSTIAWFKTHPDGWEF